MAAVITLPNTDSAILAFSLNFSTKISATPTAFGLTAAQATAYATLHSNFATALAACDPAVRSKPATSAKNDARTALKNQLRMLALAVQATPTVTDSQKISLGLSVEAGRQPVPPPVVVPQVDIVSVTGRTVRIRIHDAAGEGKRSKPAGVKGAAICSFVGAMAPTDPSAYKWEGSATRPIAEVIFPESVAPGAVVWITAMWFNERQQNGPACTPVSATINYGMSQAA
jgi:hypothetical protein